MRAARQPRPRSWRRDLPSATTGAQLAAATFPNTPDGHGDLLAWAVEAGNVPICFPGIPPVVVGLSQEL
jgi:hypothetical protein